MTTDRPMFPPRGNPFRVVGGTACPPSVDLPDEPPVNRRSRNDVLEAIEEHKRARKAWTQGVAWTAAAEAGEIPGADVETAIRETAMLFEEMQFAARRLLIERPTDLKGFVDLLMYMEQNFSTLPPEVGGNSLGLELVKTLRLSLRSLTKYGKWRGSVHDE
jgi:hypothetical protein